MSSQSSDAAPAVNGSNLKFNGKQEQWPSWRMRMLAHLAAQELDDVVLKAIAALDEEVRALLSGGAQDEGDNGNAAAAHASSSSASAPADDGAAGSSAAAASASPSAADGTPAVKADKAAAKKKAAQQEKMQQQQAAAVKKSKKAYSILLTYLSDDVVQFLSPVQAGDAHGVWKMLQSRYERKTQVAKFHSRQKLSEIKMNPQQPFDVYFTALKAEELRYKQMGGKITEEDMLYILLSNLPPAYQSLVHLLSMKEDLTLEEAAEHVRDFQERKKYNYNGREESRPSRVETAHYVKQAPKYKPQQGGNRNKFGGGARDHSNSKPGACYLCGQAGHRMYDCPKLPSTAVRCVDCHSLHTPGSTRGCRAKRAQEPQAASAEESAAVAQQVGRDEEFEFDGEDDSEEWCAYAEEEVAASVSRKSPPVSAWRNGPPRNLNGHWVLDSGCTSHLTNDANLLMDKHNIQPITVRVANKQQVMLHEAGSVRMAGEGNSSVLLRDVASSPVLGTNLVSVSKLVDSNLHILFTKKMAIVYERYGARGHGRRSWPACPDEEIYSCGQRTTNYNKSMHTPTTRTQEHKHTT